MNNYIVHLAGPKNITNDWKKRRKIIESQFFKVVNFVVENGGTVQPRKYFDVNYIYDNFFIKIDPNKLKNIEAIPEVKSVNIRSM